MKNGLQKFSIKKGSYFPVILSFAVFLIFWNQSQVFTITGQKYGRYMTISKKNRPLALKFEKSERFKIKRHKLAENLPI